MVDTGIVQKLLELLDRHVDEGNVTVQHAALSALRNLAIPGPSEISHNQLCSVSTSCKRFEKTSLNETNLHILSSGQQVEDALGRCVRCCAEVSQV